MNEAIGAVLAFAVGVGISPIPIIAVILMLFSERASVNAPLFAVGWVVGLSAVVTAAYLLAGAVEVGSSDTADGGVSWPRVIAGVALLAAAVRKWQKRPQPGDEPEMPRWMATIDKVAPGRALGLALLLAANPKNLVLAGGAATAVAGTDATTTEAVVGLAVFVLLGSAVVIGAVVYALVGGERARVGLDGAKTWLTLHNTAVMAVLFLVFGAVLLSEGLQG